MTQQIEKETGAEWKKFMRKHWTAVATFVVAGILAFAGAVYVYLWFVKDAQSTGLVPSTLGLWSMGNLVGFILHAIFWELLFIGIPVVIGAVAGWQWWKRLPEEEKREYHFFGKRKHARRGGGGVGVLFFAAFAIKIYIDGNWNTAISTYTLNYAVGSMLEILVGGIIIIGIPAAIAGIWWLRHEINKNN
jgi:hypothetical protein